MEEIPWKEVRFDKKKFTIRYNRMETNLTKEKSSPVQV